VTSGRAPRRPPRLLSVGRFFGVPIYFAPSWLIIAALLTAYYAPVIHDATDGVSSSTAYLIAAGYAIVFAFCVLAHELGHTAVALLRHLPVRRIVIFLLGGISEIEKDPDRPRDEFLVAVAGPLVSLLLTGAFLGAYEAVPARSTIGVTFLLLFWSNFAVALFNLLPGLPLDGGRLLRSAVWAAGASRVTSTKIAAWTGRGVAVAIAVFGLVADRSSWGLSAGVYGLAIAAYLWFGAGQSLRVGEIIERAGHVDLAALLRPGLFIEPGLSVAEALRRAWTGNARGLVVVDSRQHPQAIVDEALIGAVPPERRPWVAVSEVARPLEPGLVLDVGLSGTELLDAVRAVPAHEYLVVNHDGTPAGILAAADLVASLQAGPVTAQ
jgi:Zn-dependent protease